MKHPSREPDNGIDGIIVVAFDRRLKLEFQGARTTSDAGLLAYRELDAALGLTDLAGTALTECRHGKNTRHLLTGLLREPVPRIDGHGIQDGKTIELDRRETWTQ